MGHLSRKMKAAKGSGSTHWTGGGKVSKDTGGKCKGCGVPYAKMGANTFKRHLDAYNAGDDDCPDV